MKTRLTTIRLVLATMTLLAAQAFSSLLFSQDVVVTVRTLQNLLPVSLDSINVYNQTNGTTLRIGSLTQNATEYQVNLRTAEVIPIIASSTDVLSDNIQIVGSGSNFNLEADLDYAQTIALSVYTLDGKILESKTVSGVVGQNMVSFTLPQKGIYVVKANVGTVGKTFKIMRSGSDVYASQNAATVSGSSNSSLRSATISPFSFADGDRIEVYVKRGTTKSPTWQGQPANGSQILLAISLSGTVFDMTQTLSGGAQRNTIAFSGVAFFSGCYYASSFYPPGKVADYFGFQYMRDNDPDESGHNTDFLTKVAYFMMHTLNAQQIQHLADLAELQDSLVDAYAYNRLPIIKSFHRYLDNDIPVGKTTLSFDSIKQASRNLYLLDGEISYQRAKYFSDVIKSLSQAQLDSIYKWAAIGMQSWPMFSKPSISYPSRLNTLVMTNCSEMYAWIVGNITSDAYFCPERQGTYFGGFYMKDAPAVGNPGYAISTEATANKGKYLTDTLLDATQGQKIKDIYTVVKPSLLQMPVVREKIATELRKFWTQAEINKDSIMAWSAEYGELDAVYIYTMVDHFVSVGRTLTDQQKADLIILRDLDEFPCKAGKVFLYSAEIDEPNVGDTDKFFE